MSAADFRTEVVLDAPASDVFGAIATADGLRRWWSTAVSAEPAGHLRLRWSATDYLLIRVDRASAPDEVDWSFVAQRDANLPQPDEWVGTRATFRLREQDGRTRLVLTHHGLAPLDCGDVCSRGWDGFLRGSLRPLVENGAGAPYEPALRSGE